MVDYYTGTRCVLYRVPDTNLSREINFSGANEEREIFIFYFQLTTSRTDDITRWLSLLLLNVISMHTRTSLCAT